MMDVITLEASAREAGKGASRRARRAGNVPCVLYGSHVEPVTFQVAEPLLKPLIYTHETHIVHVQIDGETWECITKDIAFHPVTDRPLHADFQVLQRGEKVTLTVPVRYLGTPVGQIDGGQTSYVVHEVEVSCLPKDLPSHIDIDVSGLQIGDVLHVSDLVTENLEIHALPEQTLVAVLKPRGLMEEELEEEEGLEGELEEGEGEVEAEEEGAE